MTDLQWLWLLTCCSTISMCVGYLLGFNRKYDRDLRRAIGDKPGAIACPHPRPGQAVAYGDDGYATRPAPCVMCGTMLRWKFTAAGIIPIEDSDEPVPEPAGCEVG